MKHLKYRCNECGSHDLELPFLIYLTSNKDEWTPDMVMEALDDGEQMDGHCYCKRCGTLGSAHIEEIPEEAHASQDC